MKMCDICGKVSGAVSFDSGRGKHLCISCKFGSGEFKTQRIRKETAAEEAVKANEAAKKQAYYDSVQQEGEQRQNQRTDQRGKPRIPVLVSLDVMVGGVKSQIFYPSAIQNFSPGGICIDWEHCQECSGYAENSIHPFCIFSQFSVNNPNAKELTIRIELANAESSLEFQGQVVYTLKKNEKEFIGISFTKITPEVLASLERLCLNLS